MHLASPTGPAHAQGSSDITKKSFPHLATIKTSVDGASDHAALWVDLDL
jgi:hypothetical protein